MNLKTILLVFLLIVLPFGAQAQGGATQQLKYVQSIDAIVNSLYQLVSGEKGEERDWQLFNFLFFKDAKLIPVQEDMNGDSIVLYMKLNQYITNSGFFFQQNNFYEREIHRVVERFGNMAHVFSTYESYTDKDFKEPIGRGINSIQLHYDGLRWWIVNVYWTAETKEQPIPEKYLP